MRQEGENREEKAVKQRSHVLYLLVFFFLLPTPSFLQGESAIEQQAKYAWASREEPGRTEDAIRLWTQAVAAEPERLDLRISLAKVLGRGVRHAPDAKQQKIWADQARAAAEEAVRLGPKSADAYTIYGEALGQWADVNKGVHSLSSVRKAVSSLQIAIGLDPRHAYAHMLLAEFYRQTPRLISVGNKEKALAQAKLAVEYGPEYAINHLVLARAFLDLGKHDEAITELQKILALSAPEDAIPETHADQETAQTMLHSLGVNPPQPACGESGAACVEHP